MSTTYQNTDETLSWDNRVLCLDLGIYTGWALFGDGEVKRSGVYDLRTQFVKKPKSKITNKARYRISRVAHYCEILKELLEEEACFGEKIVYERAGFFMSTYAAQVFACLEMVLWHHVYSDRLIEFKSVRDIRKDLLGKSNAKKSEVTAYIADMYGLPDIDHNRADAIALGLSLCSRK